MSANLRSTRLSRQSKYSLQTAASPNELPRFMSRLLFLVIAALSAVVNLQAAAPVDLTPIKKWIDRQDEFKSVAASFTQSRALRSLRSPVTTPGRLWFQAPENFRWELGVPAK